MVSGGLYNNTLQAAWACNKPDNAFHKFRTATHDCYTMAYAPDGRERFVQPAMQEHLYGKLGATAGNGLGAVLINGQAQAVWTARFSGSTINIHLRHCERPGAKQRKAVTTEIGEIATFLGAGKTEIREEIIPSGRSPTNRQVEQARRTPALSRYLFALMPVSFHTIAADINTLTRRTPGQPLTGG